MGEIDLGTLLTENTRDIETITGEILRLKTQAGDAILAIGQRLIEAKELLPHGEWLPWLSERVEFSERAAQNLMRLSREWSNPQALADLGATKALTLLALPPEEREQFLSEAHAVDGKEKTVIDMSSRELEQVIRERDEARAAEQAAKADYSVAEQSRAKMQADMQLLTEFLQRARKGQAEAEATVVELRKTLAEMTEAPVDVAVMAVDQKALDDARAEAAAELQSKLAKAEEAKAKAEEKRKEAEKALTEVRARLEAMETAEKKAALTSDKDMAAVDIYFSQGQEVANKLHGLLLKFRGRDDQDSAVAVQKAMLALADAIGRAAE